MPSYDLDVLAAYAGLCPVCCHGIVAARSHVKPLSGPMPPNPAYTTYYAQRGAWLIHGQYAKRLHRRTWGHSRCVEAMDRRYSTEEQHALSDEWRACLDADKREKQRAEDRHLGPPAGKSQRSRAVT